MAKVYTIIPCYNHGISSGNFAKYYMSPSTAITGILTIKWTIPSKTYIFAYHTMPTQLKYFSQDVKRMLGKYKIRILTIWLGRVFWGVFMYRWERGWYLLFGRGYEIFRVILTPLYNLLYAYSNIEIHYKADVKGGILILHPSVGVVVSGLSIVGKNITLTGGNIIGAKAGTQRGEIVVGDNCNMGANAVIIGPVKLGNKINIGASTCVVKDCLSDNVTLIGVPAKVHDAVII